MIRVEALVEIADSLPIGGVAYFPFRKDLISAENIKDRLKGELPERTFEVHETINGYTVKSI